MPKRSKTLLENLKGLLLDLRKYANEQDCGIEIIPIIDTKDQRDLVARRASIELTAELDEVMSDFADHLKKNDGLGWERNFKNSRSQKSQAKKQDGLAPGFYGQTKRARGYN